MTISKLALFGGDPIRTKKFSQRRTVGDREKEVVSEVLDKGDLSLFFGSPGDFFLGGPYVKRFEKKWASKYGFKHGISTNSWTTGLVTAIGAIGISPGDEVLCTPYTMSATATSILFYGGIPIFVDIEPETFNIDPDKLEAKITSRTKAIMVVHLFGHPAEMDKILAIAKKHGLKVIEDAAHAPGAKYKGRYVGAIGDIGGFSLNYHKHIHSGEGGLIVTNDDDLALRCQLIRNHGENCADSFRVEDISNTIGSNYRLSELHAAIGEVQTDYIEEYVQHRNVLGEYFGRRLSEFDCFETPVIRDGCTHSFYVYAFKYQSTRYGVHRSLLSKAISAELPKPDTWEQMPIGEAYVQPLYWNRVYQEKIAFGKSHFPWSMNPGVNYSYERGLCPVVEDMHTNKLMFSPLIRESVSTDDIDDLLRAIEKVITNIDDLKSARP